MWAFPIDLPDYPEIRRRGRSDGRALRASRREGGRSQESERADEDRPSRCSRWLDTVDTHDSSFHFAVRQKDEPQEVVIRD